jgi:hypothetical protein
MTTMKRVLVSYLGQGIGHTDESFKWFSSAPLLDRDNFLQNRTQFINDLSSYAIYLYQ